MKFQGFLSKLESNQRLLNSLISSETAGHFQKHPRKLRWFCVFRSVLLDSGGFCKQKSWSPVITQTPYGVRICCIYASYPLHPRAMEDGTKCRDPHFFLCMVHYSASVTFRYSSSSESAIRLSFFTISDNNSSKYFKTGASTFASFWLSTIYLSPREKSMSL